VLLTVHSQRVRLWDASTDQLPLLWSTTLADQVTPALPQEIIDARLDPDARLLTVQTADYILIFAFSMTTILPYYESSMFWLTPRMGPWSVWCRRGRISTCGISQPRGRLSAASRPPQNWHCYYSA
jgi:hypothetical protein